MSQLSIRLDKDCHLECRCSCRMLHQVVRPLLLAICPVKLSTGRADQTPPTGRMLAIYDNGYVLLADRREDCENLTFRDVVHGGMDLLRHEFRRKEGPSESILELLDEQGNVLTEVELSDRLTCNIIVMAIQQASKYARSIRSPEVAFHTVVYEGLILLEKQYIAVTTDRLFLQDSNISVVNHPSKHAKVHVALDCLEFRPYGTDGRGLSVFDDNGKKKKNLTHLWFATPEDRSDFFEIVNERRKWPTRLETDETTASFPSTITCDVSFPATVQVDGRIYPDKTAWPTCRSNNPVVVRIAELSKSPSDGLYETTV